MARYPEYEKLYEIYATFKQRCLIEDNSYFLPDRQIWTLPNLTSLRRRLVDNPDFGEGSFETKLQLQMQGALPEEWVILAEAHLIYYLIPVTSHQRRDTVLGYLRQGYPNLPTLPTNDFWNSIKGFSSVGQQFYLRYKQIWLILMFAQAIKQSPDWAAVLDTAQPMKSLLSKILHEMGPDRAHDMRHALMYLAFPDDHEPILSNGDRYNILKTYRSRFGITEADNDIALQQSHERIAQEKGVAPSEVNFFQDDIRAVWKGEPLPPPIKLERASDVETPIVYDPEVTQGLKKLAFTKNLIFQGAPGTGKTYTAIRVARALVEKQVQETIAASDSQQELPLTVLEELKRYEVEALALYRESEGKRFTNPKIQALPLIAQYEKLKNIGNPGNVIATTLGMRVAPGNAFTNLSYTVKPYIFDRDKDGWFLSAEGRSFVEENLAGYLEMMNRPIEQRTRGRYEDYIQMVAFHPSYAYEDFVEGMRPVVDEGSLSYEIRPGILRVMCNRAGADPENRYVLIIDEINRANLSKVFGELITLIEDDKRSGQVNALTVKLPYSGDLFTVPNNLYFIGTLNTADRSIALIDVAMRRRFAFAEVLPHPDLLGEIADSDGNTLNLAALLRVLNARIRSHLEAAYEIGHSYLIGLSSVAPENQMAMLEHIWNTQLLPLLREYFYSRPDSLKEVLEEFVPEDAEPDANIGAAEAEDLMESLMRMANTRH